MSYRILKFVTCLVCEKLTKKPSKRRWCEQCEQEFRELEEKP